MESTLHEDILRSEEDIEAESAIIVPVKRLRRDNYKVDNLLGSFSNYKTLMEFKNSDFNADKVKQYEAVKREMATIYANDPSQLMSTERYKSIKVFVSHVYNFGYSRGIYYLRAITQDLRIGVGSCHIIAKFSA